MLMKYPPDFVAKVQRLLPEEEEIQKSLLNNDFMLGDLLCQATIKAQEPRRTMLLKLAKDWARLHCLLDIVAESIISG